MKQDKEILCTLGPASMNDGTIARLEQLGVNLFRINLSHTKFEDLEKVIDFIQARTKVPICLDTEGAQIRTSSLSNQQVMVAEGQLIRIAREEVVGNAECFNFHPRDIVTELLVGDLISIDFNSVLVQVVEKSSDAAMVRVLTGGVLGQNKAVSVDREIQLPALTPKDHKALALGKRKGIMHVALSFANCEKDVQGLKKIVGKDWFVISKIESLNGLRHLDGIARHSNALLIDRGDLSRQISIEQIPRLQKAIIQRGRKQGIKVYVATNLLESMIKTPTPTRAEVNDVFNTLNDGADGLVLAAETAIGAYPVKCAIMIRKIIDQFGHYSRHRQNAEQELQASLMPHSFLLVEPHGGVLVDQVLRGPEYKNIDRLTKLKVDVSVIYDAEQIALGVYSPLKGFMTRQQLKGVVQNCRLPDGNVWTVPVVAQTDEASVLKLKEGKVLGLYYDDPKNIYALLTVEEVFTEDMEKLCRSVFTTDDVMHPGVAAFRSRGQYFIAGEIKLIKRLPSDLKYYEITPQQVRTVFEHKGWSRVVAFHTRNVVHRAHEYIQLQALNSLYLDGLFIHPLIGPKKKGDYTDRAVFQSYETAVPLYYPPQKVLLAGFQNYARYAGPREAIFTAICRKNFGCTHFVVGRDHTGVGDFYPPDGARKLFNELGDLGIQPVFFDEVYYCASCGDHTQKCLHTPREILHISGTEGRAMLQNLKSPPDWFMRTSVSKYLLEQIAQGQRVFL